MAQRMEPKRKGTKKVGVAAVVLSAIGVSGTVWACADSSCYPNWRLAASDYDCAGRAVLNPGNDTRINLILLMRSLKPVAEIAPATGSEVDNPQFGRSFMSWAGLRAAFWPEPPAAVPENEVVSTPTCALSPDVVSDFNAALASEPKLSSTERTALSQLRTQVGCSDVKWDSVAITSARGIEYFAYLKAADAFYRNDWGTARQGFGALTRAKSRWVAETARYMPIRIGLRSAVANGINEYGDFDGPDKVDAASVAEASDAIAAYLKAYPKGRYAASAEGLKRRVAWLSGDTDALARAYEKLIMSTPGDDEAAAYLAEEIDIKLLERDDAASVIGKAGDTPVLLAIADLAHMRGGDGHRVALSANDLAQQKTQFSAHEELYGLLQATRAYYAGEDPQAILALLPDDAKARNFTPLAFSRQMLRGMALGRKGDPNEAGFWRDLLAGASPLYQRPLVEMGLAVRWQRDGRIDRIFAPDSPIIDATTREILLQTMAPPAILRSNAQDAARSGHERDVARFTLVYKDLNRAAFGDFVAELALVPANANTQAGLWNFTQQDEIPVGLFRKGRWSDGFPCPALAQTAATLSRVPKDHKALLCLGDFYRLNGFDGFSLFTPGKEKDALGSGPDSFPGKPMPRSDIYDAIIADRRAAPNERAYALYRAVMCYAPSGYTGCRGPYNDVSTMDAAQAPQAQRKAWFTELKTRYPNSEWAKALRYYW